MVIKVQKDQGHERGTLLSKFLFSLGIGGLAKFD